MCMNLGRLEPVAIREIWPREPEFSKWLAKPENLKVLGSLIGVDMGTEETEGPVGDFSADIVAKEAVSHGRTVIIENQYERTDHDHLGKIITYAAGRDAQILVWIAEEARDEHRSAVHWLNDHSDVDVFLMKIKVVKIGDSQPAPVFEIVEQPNNWKKNEKQASQELTTTGSLYLNFWTKFQEYAFGVHSSFHLSFKEKKISGSGRNYFPLSYGNAIVGVVVQPKEKNTNIRHVRAEIYFPDGKDLYHRLEANKQAFEAAAGFPLTWECPEESKFSRISVKREFDIDDAASWESTFAWLCDKAIALKQACGLFDIA